MLRKWRGPGELSASRRLPEKQREREVSRHSTGRPSYDESSTNLPISMTSTAIMRKWVLAYLATLVLASGCAQHIFDRTASTPISTINCSPYDFHKAWAKQRAPQNSLAKGEQIFIMSFAETNYGEILPYRHGITLPEVLAQISFSGKPEAVTIYRARSVSGQDIQGSGWVYDVNSEAAQQCRVEPCDVLELHTNIPVISR
jgi:hypothetical protein